jgi:trimeric autotransporter adhesin
LGLILSGTESADVKLNLSTEMKRYIIIVIALFTVSASTAQNITNTLGSSGNFTIKDASTTYLNLSQSTGNLTLIRGITLSFTSSSTTGIIFKGNTRFIHDFTSPGSQGNNIFIGLNSGNFTMTGTSVGSSYNTAVGSSTLTSLTTGYYNSAFGYSSMFDNTTGNSNSSFGYNALANNTTGSSNSAFGFESLFFNISDGSNSSFGYQSMRVNNGGDQNSSFGSQSMWSNTTGNNNCSFGFHSLFSNSTASFNSSFGHSSLSNNNGADNNAFGYNSMNLNSFGTDNCAFGNSSLLNNSTGSSNIAVGNSSLFLNTIGFRNTAIGDDAGSTIVSGSNLTLLGYNAEPTSSTATNQITLGNTSVTSLRCNVTTITSLSDARDKKNIKDLTLGLDFIAKLRPRLYNWDKREWYENNTSDGSKMQEAPTVGFIAQELDEAQTTGGAEWLNLVLKDNPEKWEATPGNLLPVIVKAIQELKNENDELKNRNQSLEDNLLKLLEMQNNLDMEIQKLNSNDGGAKEVKLMDEKSK